MNISTVKQLARAEGFHAVGITPFTISAEAEKHFFDWRAKGYAAEMKFIAGYEARRDRFLEEIGWAKSVIALGVNYYQESQDEIRKANKKDFSPDFRNRASATGKIARYAWGEDYHKVIRRRHEKLIRKFSGAFASGARFYSSVDTQPVFEREMARRAGLGFIGKQSQLLSLEFGPWLFLSEIFTDLELEPDTPYAGSCGTCRLCVDHCPTGAIQNNYEVNSTQCISYLTIEHPGEIPPEIQPKMKNWFFGCDECLTICPYTAKARPTDWEEFRASEEKSAQWVGPDDILSIKSQGEFRRKFGHRALARIRLKQAVRNMKIVIQNSAES
ncbi:MAG: tRNA epoxyqueuosine(34) reductase QueG [Candidatus Omnitrophica bacterium]|nr:tRNA epoxyqueuosine(34) reductase QueG [Candidatus Omnitrophota bacterium]